LILYWKESIAIRLRLPCTQHLALSALDLQRLIIEQTTMQNMENVANLIVLQNFILLLPPPRIVHTTMLTAGECLRSNDTLWPSVSRARCRCNSAWSVSLSGLVKRMVGHSYILTNHSALPNELLSPHLTCNTQPLINCSSSWENCDSRALRVGVWVSGPWSMMIARGAIATATVCASHGVRVLWLTKVPTSSSDHHGPRAFEFSRVTS